jgi:hypothetical protein
MSKVLSHTHTHIYTHTYTYTHIHTYTRIHTHTHIHTCIHFNEMVLHVFITAKHHPTDFPKNP